MEGTLLANLKHCKTGNNQSVDLTRDDVRKLLWKWRNDVGRRAGWVLPNRLRRLNRRYPIGELDRDLKTLPDRGPLLFPDSSEMRKLFMEACKRLNFVNPPCRFVPHSLRHGGATRDFTSRSRSMDEILMRGRWAAIMSTRHYIQAGPALAAAASQCVPKWRKKLALGISINMYPFINWTLTQ